MERRQTGQEPQEPNNYMVVRPLDFIFASDTQKWQLRKSVTQGHQWSSPEKPSKRLPFLDEGPGKGNI